MLTFVLEAFTNDKRKGCHNEGLMNDNFDRTIDNKMPHTQDKQFKCNFTNNNDHNYLHKKFKKMASTASVSATNHAKENDINYSKENEVNGKDLDVTQSATNSSISNGSIAAAHPEIEKIKKHWLDNLKPEKDVQISFSDENSTISELNINSGQTSNSEEFPSKTDNPDNDFAKDVQTAGSGGRYVCPYCKLSCAKPSVLQKHIRAHTNERPYPCVPCGFAFKTKSNLYKHRRSRTHALRLQGTDVSSTQDDDWSAGSESDTSLPPISISDNVEGKNENYRPSEFSSPELTNERMTPPNFGGHVTENNKMKSIYKPKFRAAFYQEHDYKQKKLFSTNAEFLNEHISKIISDNEAIVDVIETPLQKKYGKIKQIAESKQLHENIEVKSEFAPLNLTKSCDTDNGFRKRSHSESFSQTNQKHPLNPEGSIIKDLLLKTKSGNGLIPLSSEVIDGGTPLYMCPLCQIPYRSAENLEIHRTYYCKGNATNLQLVYPAKDVKVMKSENIYIRSHSINTKFPETQSLSKLNSTPSPPLRINKPENLVIIKPENNEIIQPLPSPGPLLGNTRLVDSRLPSEYVRKSESLKCKPMQSPKRRIDSRSESYSPRLTDNISPRSLDMYSQAKIRCLESANLRSLDEFSNNRHNTTSLQMFGGEVKIVDYSGGTTTLRIEPSKSQLSPILIQNMSPSKVGEVEASSVVVRSGLHSGGTIVHNLPTPKETTPHSQMSRITSATLHTPIHEIPHFQFPPLSAITAFNPLTLPPLSPSASPNGASTIMHGGKLIPHVPGIPGPNTAGVFTGSSNVQQKPAYEISNTTNTDATKNYTPKAQLQSKAAIISKFDNQIQNIKNHSVNKLNSDVEKNVISSTVAVPVIKVKNIDDSKINTSNVVKSLHGRQETSLKRSVDGSPRVLHTKDNQQNNKLFEKTNTTIAEDIRNYNFENLITKAEIFNNQMSSSTEVQKNINAEDCMNKNGRNERSETLYFQKNSSAKYGSEERKPKFLRPSTLPLKPGTFTPKRHHGITPNANTMPLVSPETPRPAKAYGQLYLNGNAYTYLGLKCSTKVFYCTINRPQPTYVHNQHFLSMYSNWQLLSEITPDPFGLTASSAMSLYDSRHRPQNITIALIKHDLILTHSSQWKENKVPPALDARKCDEGKVNGDNPIIPKKELTGGFESNEEYTYVRGRGRGRYVCSECGIRCKKPSMLKKHIRTHTDVRPYTCTHCAFSFKTKGNLTKHMKSKAHYKKCCELGINPNEGNETEGGDNAQGSGETDEDTDSDGDEGNEGETESSDTETCKSRLPDHEAAHCLLSLGSSRPTTSATPGLITSARPSTYPYTPTGVDAAPLDQSQTIEGRTATNNQSSDQNKMDVDNEPIDLSKSDAKPIGNVTEIPTAHESSVLASLASNTAKLPQHHNQWSNGEPMLHAYLTERALLDSKIKQSQLSSSLNKIQKLDSDKTVFQDKNNLINNTSSKQTLTNTTVVTMANNLIVSSSVKELPKVENATFIKTPPSKDSSKSTNVPKCEMDTKPSRTIQFESTSNTENAKFVVSEYLKHAKVNALNENSQYQSDNSSENSKPHIEDGLKIDESSNSDTDTMKMPVMNHDLVAQKVVIGAGGVAFKVCSKGKEFEPSPSYTPGKLMEDGRRVCDFCNKTFTKPSQLKIHLNIHYMERPYRCSACAVSFRTRGHLQKHERSGSHHNKVSMTSTFGAATSLNPRPFRCSDCNIAFRIHGHLAKHLRSKMHVMKLECLFKLPFGTFTEIERAGVSLTDIDTTDCASSLASLQLLAQKLHEKDPTKLEYRDPNNASVGSCGGRESSEDEDFADKSESERDSDVRTTTNNDNVANETRIIYSATDN